MAKQNPFKDSPMKPASRMDYPAWRYLSIIIAVGTIGVLAYSIIRQQWVIPISAIGFFLIIWLWPAIWDWIVFIFSKRPTSIWGRISLNLVIATLLAVIFEDFYELVIEFFRMILNAIR